MGVKNLWKLIEPYGSVESACGKKLAVDVSIWIHQLSHISEAYIPYVVIKRIIKLLSNHIKPIFVFDGGIPSMKEKCARQRREGLLKTMERQLKANDGKYEFIKFDPQKYTVADEEVIKKIKEHNFNWGELSDDTEEEVSVDSEDRCLNDSESTKININENSLLESHFVNPISLVHEEYLSELPRSQRLRKLVEMREFRKHPMKLELKSPVGFSLSQVENVKKRNMVRRLIDKIGSDGQKRMQGNCKEHIEYQTLAGGCNKNEECFDKSMSGNDDWMGSNESSLETQQNTIGEKSRNKLYEKYGHILKYGEDFSTSSVNNFTYKLNSKYSGFTPKTFCQEPKKEEDSIEWMHRMAAECSEGDIDNLTYRACKGDSNGRPSRLEKSTPCFIGFLENENQQLVNDLAPLNGRVQTVHKIIKEILEIFNICFIDSPEEADSQCAFLFNSGIVDGVITEDNDLILHGATIYRNFFSKNKLITVYTFEKISRELSLTKLGMIKLSFLLGSDYTPGVWGIGIKRALSNLSIVTDENIAEIERIYTKPNVRRISGFENGTLERNTLESYLGKTSLPKERIEELLFYISTVSFVK
ncbi:hypothetical protein PAEPH01_0535 [Pancytospora epiphaga]|nr:hypothetical protein PAEPH01_0535 [Pancytospora epiphaga]